MGAYRGGVQDQRVQVGLVEHGQDRVPAAFGGPTIEASPLAVAVTKTLGQIFPGNAGARDVQDRIDELPIVFGDASVLAALARK